MKREAFKIQYQLFGFIICCFICIVNDVLYDFEVIGHFIMAVGLSFYNDVLICNTGDLEVLFYYLKLKWQSIFTFSCFFRVFITKCYKFFYCCLNFSNIAPQGKFCHQNQFQEVVYDVVDTFTKFDVVLICRSKVIIRSVLLLVRALIDIIMPPLWIFSKACYL